MNMVLCLLADFFVSYFVGEIERLLSASKKMVLIIPVSMCVSSYYTGMRLML